MRVEDLFKRPLNVRDTLTSPEMVGMTLPAEIRLKADTDLTMTKRSRVLWELTLLSVVLIALSIVLVVRNAYEADSGSYGVIVFASAGTDVCLRTPGKPETVTFPIPGTYRDQVPLTFRVSTNPPEALRGFRWKQRPDGVNWLCEIDVEPPEQGATVKWESFVLLLAESPARLPAHSVVEPPDAASEWLRPTACVQSDDPQIQSKADELAAGTDDVQGIVQRAITFTSGLQNRCGDHHDSLDARKGLDCGGSCTNRANLAAALLRAQGIPARTLAHLPTWSGRLYEHWLIEYWHPQVGWVWAESSTGELQPERTSIVVLNVANPFDEDRAFDDSMRHSGIIPGAPEWSVHKLSDELTRCRTDPEYSGNCAIVVLESAEAENFRALCDDAQLAYAQLRSLAVGGESDLELYDRIKRAVRIGTVPALRKALRRAANSQGPTE